MTNPNGDEVWNGDLWAETVDDLVLQIGNRAGDIPEWIEEETGEEMSFFAAIWKAVSEEWSDNSNG